MPPTIRTLDIDQLTRRARAKAPRPLTIVAATFPIVVCALWSTGSARAAGAAPPTGAHTTVAAIQSETPSQAVLDTRLVADFRRRADAYVKLQEKLKRQGTRQKERGDIGENLVSRQALAMRIRFARHDARPGDLFTPPIAMALRRAMDPELRGLAKRTTRDSIREDGPEVFVLAVNADYPAGAPRATMPGSVLKILPPLPVHLEYRIVDTHLVLMDLDANIIVDYVLDVMCRTC